MAWTSPSIKTTELGASRNFHIKNETMPWKDVVEIIGITLDKITYQEDFLILRSNSGFIAFGELDKNFRDFEVQLFEQVPGLPNDWQRTLRNAGPDVRCTLWTKPALLA